MESKLSMQVCEIKTGSVGIKHFFPQLWLHIRITWRTSGTLDVLPEPLANQMGISGSRIKASSFFFLISSSDTSMPLSVKGTQTEYRAIKT